MILFNGRSIEFREGGCQISAFAYSNDFDSCVPIMVTVLPNGTITEIKIQDIHIGMTKELNAD